MTNLTDITSITRKRRVSSVSLFFVGLLPNTKYTITLNGEDMGFCTRVTGISATDFGDDLFTDAEGVLSLETLIEVPTFINASKNNTIYDKNPFTKFGSVTRNNISTDAKIKRNIQPSNLVYEVSNSTGLSKAQRVINSGQILIPHNQVTN